MIMRYFGTFDPGGVCGIGAPVVWQIGSLHSRQGSQIQSRLLFKKKRKQQKYNQNESETRPSNMLFTIRVALQRIYGSGRTNNAWIKISNNRPHILYPTQFGWRNVDQ